MKQLRKHIWIVGAVLIVAGLMIFNCSIAYKIDSTLKGAECRIGDADYSEDVTITVKGVYHKFLFKNDKFKGTISIDKYNFTNEVPLSPLIFQNGYAPIRYTEINNSIKVFNLGFIYCTPNFDKILIGVREPIGKSPQGWSGDNGLYITAPAENHMQAVEIAKYFSSKYEWINHAKWD
jgi:heme/copper-type cytochrome/quinol oxidase subunit 2